MNQKEAVFTAILNVVGHIEGNMNETITKEQRAQVNAILFEGFRSGQVQIATEFTDAELKQYCSGLQSNWLRKDTRLNGGVKYVAKKPGSRAGSGDEQLKAIRALKSTLPTDHPDYQEVCAAESARLAELNKEKVKVIDFSALPASLAAKFAK